MGRGCIDFSGTVYSEWAVKVACIQQMPLFIKINNNLHAMIDYYKKIVGEENWKKRLEVVVETSYMPQLDMYGYSENNILHHPVLYLQHRVLEQT